MSSANEIRVLDQVLSRRIVCGCAARHELLPIQLAARRRCAPPNRRRDTRRATRSCPILTTNPRPWSASSLTDRRRIEPRRHAGSLEAVQHRAARPQSRRRARRRPAARQLKSPRAAVGVAALSCALATRRRRGTPASTPRAITRREQDRTVAQSHAHASADDATGRPSIRNDGPCANRATTVADDQIARHVRHRPEKIRNRVRGDEQRDALGGNAVRHEDRREHELRALRHARNREAERHDGEHDRDDAPSCPARRHTAWRETACRPASRSASPP